MPDSLPVHGDTIIVDMIRKFAQERLAPLAAEREKAGRIEPEIIRELGELGVFGATTPVEWDGSDIDPVTYALVLEEIAAGDGSVSTMVSVHNSPTCIVIANSGRPSPKRVRTHRTCARGR
jgi:alkylation response protein AidB-like acyl-CoA dehydrogenase